MSLQTLYPLYNTFFLVLVGFSVLLFLFLISGSYVYFKLPGCLTNFYKN